MKCQRCGEEMVIPEKVYKNLMHYAGGEGSRVVASKCCGAPYIIRMSSSFYSFPYEGKETEDDWGTKIKPFNKESNEG